MPFWHDFTTQVVSYLFGAYKNGSIHTMSY